jgi:hypothetical protein
MYLIDTHNTTGYDIPGYYAKKKRGDLLPMTPFTQVKISGNCTGNLSSTFPSGNRIYYDPGYPHSTLWQISSEDLHDLAESYDPTFFVQAAAAAIYSSGWDTLTFVAELHKAIRMLRSILKRAIRLTSSGRFDKMWLEYRYGWRTLYFDLQDLEGAVKNINKDVKRFKERVGTDEVTLSVTNYLQETSAVVYNKIVTDSLSVGLRGSVVADIVPPRFQFNPAITAWELVTFSFMIDRVIHIGQALTAISFLLLQTRYTAAGGVHLELSRSLTSGDITHKPGCTGVYSLDGQCTGQITIRTPTSVTLQPLPRLRFGTAEIVDLISILIGRISKRAANVARLGSALIQDESAS